MSDAGGANGTAAVGGVVGAGEEEGVGEEEDVDDDEGDDAHPVVGVVIVVLGLAIVKGYRGRDKKGSVARRR